MYKIDAVYLTTPDSVSVAHVLVWFGAVIRFERRSMYRTVVTQWKVVRKEHADALIHVVEASCVLGSDS